MNTIKILTLSAAICLTDTLHAGTGENTPLTEEISISSLSDTTEISESMHREASLIPPVCGISFVNHDIITRASGVKISRRHILTTAHIPEIANLANPDTGVLDWEHLYNNRLPYLYMHLRFQEPFAGEKHLVNRIYCLPQWISAADKATQNLSSLMIIELAEQSVRHTGIFKDVTAATFYSGDGQRYQADSMRLEGIKGAIASPAAGLYPQHVLVCELAKKKLPFLEKFMLSKTHKKIMRKTINFIMPADQPLRFFPKGCALLRQNGMRLQLEGMLVCDEFLYNPVRRYVPFNIMKGKTQQLLAVLPLEPYMMWIRAIIEK